MKNLKKYILACLVFLFGLFLIPSVVSADEGNTLRHAYKPVTVQSTNWMRARVNNHTQMAQKRLVCVEAFNNANNMKTHLGCLWVDLAPMWSQTGNWAMEFNAPTHMLAPGSYTVVYTYQDEGGMWHRIKSMNMQMQDGMYVR